MDNALYDVDIVKLSNLRALVHSSAYVSSNQLQTTLPLVFPLSQAQQTKKNHTRSRIFFEHPKSLYSINQMQ